MRMGWALPSMTMAEPWQRRGSTPCAKVRLENELAVLAQHDYWPIRRLRSAAPLKLLTDLPARVESRQLGPSGSTTPSAS